MLGCAGRGWGLLHDRERGGETDGEAASLEEFEQPPCDVTGMEMTSLGQPVAPSPPLYPPLSGCERELWG